MLFFSTNIALNVSIFTLTMRSTFTFFYIPNEKKTSKSGILQILPSWYILSLKPKGKGNRKKLNQFSSVSCLFIFFNLDDEFWIICDFFNWLNYNFTR